MSEIVGETVGRVKWFNGRKGFGFVTSIGTENPTDVFVHHSVVRVADEQYKYLVEGEYVSFNITTPKDVEAQQHKHQATDVTGVFGGKLMCETRNASRDTHSNGWQHTGRADPDSHRSDCRHDSHRSESHRGDNRRY